MTQFQTAWPAALSQQCADRSSVSPVRVFAQDETRLGLFPGVRRRSTACGVQPVATVTHTFDNFSLYGAVEPTTGDSFFLALPHLNSATVQLWVDGFGAAFPESCHFLVLDNGALHTAKALQWPSHVVPVFCPPYSPELHPLERVWRDLKDQLADCMAKTLDALSEAVCALMQNYSHATRQALTRFAYFVHAVETAQKTIYV